MDVRDLLSLLRNRLRSEADPDFSAAGTPHARPDSGSASDPTRTAERDAAGGRSWRRILADGDDRLRDGDPADARDRHRFDVASIDGRHGLARALRDFADAEGRSHRGGIIVVAGIDPGPPENGDLGRAGNDESAGDGWRIVPVLRRHRPDLELWTFGRGEVSPAGALVVGNLDPANRTLDLEFGRIVADGLAIPAPDSREPVVGHGNALSAAIEAIVAAVVDRRGTSPTPPVEHESPAPGQPLPEPGWRRAEERCIHAYYEGRRAEGLTACEEVLASPDAPQAVRNQTLRNETFYAPPLASLVRTFDHRRIDLDLPPGWFATNPSIAASDDGFLAIVRTLDYEIVGPYRYRFNDPHGRQNTVNHLVRLDRDLRPVASFPVVDATLLAPRHPCRYAGLEDCRLVRWQGGWVASCGTVDRTPSCVGMIDLVRLDPATGAFHAIVPLSDRASSRWEKNWMPVVAGDNLLFVYGCDPLSVLRLDPELGAVVPHRQHAAPPLAREIKGGSQGVRVPGGWLFCVHQSADFPDRNRCYLHRFMRLDDEFRLTHLSRPFTFLAPGIEFCAGLALRGDDLVASFGVEDREAHLVRTTLPEALALLEPAAFAADARRAGGGEAD